VATHLRSIHQITAGFTNQLWITGFEQQLLFPSHEAEGHRVQGNRILFGSFLHWEIVSQPVGFFEHAPR
jgi:hypothetical protein